MQEGTLGSPSRTFWMVVLSKWRPLWTRPWSTWHWALAQEQGRNGDRPSGKSRPPASVSISGMAQEGQMNLMNYLRDRSSSVSIPEGRPRIPARFCKGQREMARLESESVGES